MFYADFIQDNFLIDEPKTGALVPFKFNDVQSDYYQMLCDDYDIENKGLMTPVREDIMKARREGFSSFILSLFAADDMMAKHPTGSQVISYKDDATAVFRKRYRNYVLSCYASLNGLKYAEFNEEQIKKFAKEWFSSFEGGEIIYKHNGAAFTCGTASARVGGRGGVLQKILFSEHHHYPDSEKMAAKEIVEATARQVDIDSGWIFKESTGNGRGNYAYKSYMKAYRGNSRYKGRFFGWRHRYSEEQFKIIASEFTDVAMLKQEYPETVEEAFMFSGQPFVTQDKLDALIGVQADKDLVFMLAMTGTNYVDQCEIIKTALLAEMRTHPNRALFVGIDQAKKKDHTFVTVLRRNAAIGNGGIKAISIDSTGQGDFMPDWFERNTRWYIARVTFSRPTKDNMYKHLQVVIDKKLTNLPVFKVGDEFVSEEHQLFYEQMLELQKDYVGGVLVVGHPPDGHDDGPDSWALAEHSYKIIQGVPKSAQTPEQSNAIVNPVDKLLQTSFNNSATINVNTSYE